MALGIYANQSVIVKTDVLFAALPAPPPENPWNGTHAWMAFVRPPIIAGAPIAGAFWNKSVSMLVHVSLLIAAAGLLLLAVNVGAGSGRSSL